MKYSFPREIVSTGPEDGPEEGEIVSDDLEDISDESIIFTSCNGKSVSRSDHLNALSLSSVTDNEDFPVKKPRKRRRSYCERHAKRRRRSRRKMVDSDSSDDDTTLDRRLKLQLQAAVRVDVEEAHKNSLRTRLWAMAHSNSGPESDNGVTEQKLKENGSSSKVSSSENALCTPEKDVSVIYIDSGPESIVSAPETTATTTKTIVSTTEVILSAPENLESGSEPSKDDIDIELRQLRLEALKTAIDNKFANRKRRKKDNTTSDDTNKENTNNNNDESSEIKTEIKVDIPQISPQLIIHEPQDEIPSTPEEDEDVLRALLLASMSKKITSIEQEPRTEPIVPTIHRVQPKPVMTNINRVAIKKTGNINNFKLNNVKKLINNGKTVVNKASGHTKLVKVPQVKPLIISVNSDSDSDLDLSSSPEKSPKKVQKETNIKPVKENAAKNLEVSIESSVEEFLREQRAKVESEIQKVNKVSLEPVVNVVEAKKIVTKSKTVVSEIKLGSINMIKSTRYAKNGASNLNKIVSIINKPVTNTNKNIQALKLTPENPKNLKLANLEKSALKFLPENKREEYKKLQNMLMLRRAQLRKPRVRRASQKVSDNNVKNLVNNIEPVSDKNQPITKHSSCVISKGVSTEKPDGTKKVTLPNEKPPAMLVVPKAIRNNAKLVNNVVKSEVIQKKDNASQLSKIEARNLERRNQQLRVETRNQERKSDALLLHTTLKQMQTRIDGRLQIQERYKSLRPLIKKINDVSKEQKHWDQEVKILLERLTEARKKQQDVHKSMSTFVKELVEKKQRMDESTAKISNRQKVSNLVTSTPLKQNIPISSLDISAVDGPGSLVSLNMTLTNEMSVTNAEKTLENKKDNSQQNVGILKHNDLKDMVNNTWDQSTKVDDQITLEIDNVKRVVSDTELVVMDPNDIDKVIRKTEEKVAVLEKKDSSECRRSEKMRYVSPLDTVKRKEEFDPFAIMCPFEVNGTCKDSECTFKHLSK